MLAHGFEHVQSTQQIGGRIEQWIVDAPLVPNGGGEVEYHIATANGLLDRCSIGDRSLEKARLRDPLQIDGVAAGEIIEHSDIHPASNQHLGKIRSDEPGATGYENGLHHKKLTTTSEIDSSHQRSHKLLLQMLAAGWRVAKPSARSYVSD